VEFLLSLGVALAGRKGIHAITGPTLTNVNDFRAVLVLGGGRPG
jgi:glycerate-2-kinase